MNLEWHSKQIACIALFNIPQSETRLDTCIFWNWRDVFDKTGTLQNVEMVVLQSRRFVVTWSRYQWNCLSADGYSYTGKHAPKVTTVAPGDVRTFEVVHCKLQSAEQMRNLLSCDRNRNFVIRARQDDFPWLISYSISVHSLRNVQDWVSLNVSHKLIECGD